MNEPDKSLNELSIDSELSQADLDVKHATKPNKPNEGA